MFGCSCVHLTDTTMTGTLLVDSESLRFQCESAALPPRADETEECHGCFSRTQMELHVL